MRLNRNHEKGSVTLVAFCFTIIIGIALASYIAVCTRSLDLSTRELHNHSARNLAEIGLEEALWSLNQSSAGNWSTNGAWSTTGSSTKTFTFTGYALGQGATGAVAVTVTNYASSAPTITSASTITLLDGRTFTKTLVATTKPAPLFGNAVASTNGSVNFNPGGTVDSFDSRQGIWAASNKGDGAIIAGLNVTITNGTITGYVSTYGSSVSKTSTGKVRSLAVNAHDSSRCGQSAFIPVFSFVTPDTSGAPTVSGIAQNLNVSGETYTSSTPDLNVVGLITVDKAVKLVVPGSLTITSTGEIRVRDNGGSRSGSIQIFVGGDVTIDVTSNGIVNTQTDVPAKAAVFCSYISALNGFRYNTTRPFTGVVYSVNRSISITTNATINGALLCGQDINLTNSPTIHYDMALSSLTKDWFSDVSTPFIVDTLTE